MTTETTTAIHCFEAAGLGKAPFRYVGMEHQEISYGQRVVSIQGANGPVQCETKPGGSCAYCGQYIVNMFVVESADGQRFHVGCDCIKKTGDAGLIKRVKAELSARDRERRQAKKIAANAADKLLCQTTDFAAFDDLPHPHPARAAAGEKLGDWCRWMLDMRNYFSLARMIEKNSKKS